jgi:hypothetical protein
MSGHSINLEYLCSKLHSRYGAQDPLFLQAKSELDTFKVRVAKVPMRQDWGVSYRKLVNDHKRELAH